MLCAGENAEGNGLATLGWFVARCRCPKSRRSLSSRASIPLGSVAQISLVIFAASMATTGRVYSRGEYQGAVSRGWEHAERGNHETSPPQILASGRGRRAVPPYRNSAWTQSLSDVTVRLIVPFPAGGGPTFVARLIGQWLSERLGQQFVIENRPGAGTQATSLSCPGAPGPARARHKNGSSAGADFFFAIAVAPAAMQA